MAKCCSIHPSKKRVIISQDRLSEELQAKFAEAYPNKDEIESHIIRVDKPDGTFICCLPFETEETSYLVKIKFVIDKNPDEDMEKDDYVDDADGNDMAGADDLADETEDESDNE